MSGSEMWSHDRPQEGVRNTLAAVAKQSPLDVSGFGVEAIDGSIGKVDSASYEAKSSWIVVDTGHWIFGKKVLLPAGVIDRIDYDDEKVYVDRTKEQIKAAPEFDALHAHTEAYRSDVGNHYGSVEGGYREFDESSRPL